MVNRFMLLITMNPRKSTRLPDPMFNHIARDSRFFTMDVVRRADTNEWMIMELGDGQVAGLDEPPEQFYRRLLTFR